MARTEAVRILRVESQERGATEVTRKLNAIGASADKAGAAIDRYEAAGSKIAPLSEALAKSQDGFAKATISTARSIQNLERRIDPVYRALNDYEKAQKRVNLAVDAGHISAVKGASILSGYELQYVKAAQASQAMGRGVQGVNDNVRLASHQILNLTRQGNDVVTMFALGADPMTIFASQVGQVYDSISLGEGGLAGGLKGLKNSAKAGLTQVVAFGAGLGPLGLGIAAVTAGVAAFAYAFREDFPDLNETLDKHRDLISRIEAEYVGLKQRIEDVGHASETGLNIGTGATARDLDTLLKREMHTVDVGFTSSLGQAIFGAFDFADAYTSGKFAPIKASVDEFRQSLKDGDPDVEKFRQTLSDLYRMAGDDEDMKKAIERAYRLTETLAGLEDRAKQTKVALEEMAKTDATRQLMLQHGADTRLTDADRKTRELDLELRAIRARTVFEKAMIAAERERLRNAGNDKMTPDQDRFAQQAASQKVFAEATRQASDALREARTAMDTAGLDGYAQGLAAINSETARQIELNPENAATWRQVAAARRAVLAGDTVRSLYDPLREHLRSITAEADAIGASDTARRRMLASLDAENTLRRQGVDLGSAFAAGYRRDVAALSDFEAEVQKHAKVWDDIKDTGGEAIDKLVGSFTSAGSSIEDTLADIARDFEKTFAQLAIANPLKNALLGTDLPTLGTLFSKLPGAPSLSTPSLAGLGTIANPMYVVPVAGTGSLVGSLFGGAANDNFLKGYRPGDVTRAPLGAVNDNLSAAARAIKSIESGGNYSALGPLTKSGDRAYGAYQVMGANVGPWTQKAVGYAMTPKQFMAAPWAQDAVFNRQFGGYATKYGSMQDAASAWFTGRPLSGGANAVDVLGTTGSQYVDKFNAALGKATDATGVAAKGLGNLGSGFNKFGQNLSNWFPSAPGGGGGWSPGSLFQGIGNFFKFGGSGQAFAATFTPGMYAKGTQFAPGGMAIVGEEGPEVVELPRGAKVVANDRLRAHLAATPLAGSSKPRSDAAAVPQPIVNLHQHFGGAFSIDDVRKMAAEGSQSAVDTVKSSFQGWSQEIKVHGAIA